jgi:hypothetical protein
MKKLALALTLFLFCFILKGQERVNRDKLSFIESSQILTKATGWAFNSTLGEWIDFENVISDNKDYKGKYKSLQGDWMMSRTYQNFIDIQSKTLLFNNIKYYVLIINKWYGKYEYPSIKEDWYTYVWTRGYIYTEEEFKKLESFEKNIEIKTDLWVDMGSKYEKYDETIFLDLIQTKFTQEKDKYSGTSSFPLLKTDKGGIRFYLPPATKSDFEKAYFETDYESFSKILIK